MIEMLYVFIIETASFEWELYNKEIKTRINEVTYMYVFVKSLLLVCIQYSFSLRPKVLYFEDYMDLCKQTCKPKYKKPLALNSWYKHNFCDMYICILTVLFLYGYYFFTKHFPQACVIREYFGKEKKVWKQNIIFFD